MMMLREETFERVARDFGTSVGVAHMIRWADTKRSSKKVVNEVIWNSDEVVINGIITKSIREGLYQNLFRRIYYYKGRGYKKIKEVTIYKKAYKDINGNSKSYTKSGKIFS